jgi:hypothetical protein
MALLLDKEQVVVASGPFQVEKEAKLAAMEDC